MADKISPRIVSLSLATVSGTVYVLCAIFIAIAPQTALSLSKDLFHGIDITQIARTTVTLGSTVAGFVEIIVLSLLVGWVFAVIYNYISIKIK